MSSTAKQADQNAADQRGTVSPAPDEIDVPPNTLNEKTAIELERKNLRLSRNKKTEAWTGVGCSGGGVRAATFCLGAIQRLAGAGLLKQIDYLSTVSGGGYTGSSLQWWWHRDPGSDAGDNFPYGVQLRDKSPRLRFLRNHGSYLTPGDGITYWSGIAVVLRTILLNLIVWFPLLVFTVLALLLPAKLLGDGRYRILWTDYFGTTEYPPFFAVFFVLALLIVAALIFSAVLLAWTSILIPPETNDSKQERFRRAVVCTIVGLVLLALAAFGLQYGRLASDYASSMEKTFAGLSIYVAGLFSIWTILILVPQLMDKLPVGLNYVMRRFFDSHAGDAMVFAFAAAVIGSIPLVADLLVDAGTAYQKTATVAGALTAAGGIISALYGHLVQAQRASDSFAGRWLAAIAAALFIYGLAIFAYLIADFVVAQTPIILRAFPELCNWREQTVVVVSGAIVFAGLFGWYTNLNHLGMHRYYRDRLMEAFMPSYDQSGNPLRFTEAEGTTLTEIWPVSPEPGSRSGRPYPLINTNVILVNDPNIKLQVRGGDSFVLSPLLVGSSATGWLATSDHIKKHGPLTLASAMAGSGAAANANAAYIGSGITRDRIISALMMILNVRLGIWIGSPSGKPGRPNHFRPALTHGIFRWGYRRTSRFIELSDGGHFDNLGIYELVRRQVDLMIIIDAEEDPSTAMTALVSVCQRVREDFDAEIKIGDAADILHMKERDGYPLGAKFAQQPFFYCAVDYANGKSGALVYIKASMIKGLGFTVRGYRASNAAFPNQPTADQFFDPAQFEAYRELGFACASEMIDHFGLEGQPLLDKVFTKMNLPIPSKPPPPQTQSSI
jgi:hypothetical protein